MTAIAAVATAPTTRRRFIPELVVVHAEELGFLWARRRATVASASLTLRHLSEINERIEAHTQGLLVAADALAEVLAPQFASAERDEVFSVAYPLLRADQPALARRVTHALASAKGGALAGLRDALCLAGIRHTESMLCEIFEQGDAAHAAAAGAALASNKRLDPTAPRLAELLGDDNSAVAQLAWQIVTWVDRSELAPARPFVEAIRSKDAGVREAALRAAIWRGETWAPGVVRALAEAGDLVGLGWYAGLGDGDAAPVFRQALANGRCGPVQLKLAGRFGHPAMIEALLEAMCAADPLAASAAGEAFTRLTGVELEGSRLPPAVADNASDFDREFALEVFVPDASRARAHWERDGVRLRNGSRWCRGCEISSALTRDAQQCIDLEAFWDFGARATLSGRRVFAPPAPHDFR